MKKIFKHCSLWIKKNTITIWFVFLLFFVLIISALAFWLKIKDFKVTDLIHKLQLSETKNELAYLEAKKELLIEKGSVKEEEIKAIEVQIKEQNKKAEMAKAQIEGLSNEDIADRLTKLGF